MSEKTCVNCGRKDWKFTADGICEICFRDKRIAELEALLEKTWAEHDPAILKMAARIAELEAMNRSLEFDRKNLLMFFQVASEALGIDPSCEPGKLDPMCAADAVRGLKATARSLFEASEKVCAAKFASNLASQNRKTIDDLSASLTAARPVLFGEKKT